MVWLTPARVSINWFFSCDKSSYIRFVYSQYHMDLLKCTQQNVNNQTLKQFSQLYVHVSFCVKVIRSRLNLPTGGHGHVICMGDLVEKGVIFRRMSGPSIMTIQYMWQRGLYVTALLQYWQFKTTDFSTLNLYIVLHFQNVMFLEMYVCIKMIEKI